MASASKNNIYINFGYKDDLGSPYGNASGSATLTVTVNGSRINWSVTANIGMPNQASGDYGTFPLTGTSSLSVYDYPAGTSQHDHEFGSSQYNFREVNGVSSHSSNPHDFQGTWSGSYPAPASSGIVSLKVSPPYPLGTGMWGSVIVEVPYSGATPADPISGSVSATNIYAGSVASVSFNNLRGGTGTISVMGLTRLYRSKDATFNTWSTTSISVTPSSRGVQDSIPASYKGGKVYYRLSLKDSSGDTATIESPIYSVPENTSPTTPPSISVPSAISGGTSITVSWGESSDNENNLEGYILQRSTDGGTSWEQVYQGSALFTSNTVVAGTEAVMYRVKAYDSLGAESGWKTSAQITVSNNSAPNPPVSITVSNIVVAGQNLSVSWGEATDDDGDTVAYELSRSVDSGATYEIVYSGPNRAFVDTVNRSWKKIKYRVRAFDPYNAYSDYKTSPERTVTTNNIPKILCEQSSSLGTIADADIETFGIAYSVSDDDPSDTLTVYEKLDGITKKSFVASRLTEYTFDFTDGNGDSYWQTTLNGSHTIEISVTDSKSTDTKAFTFIKKQTWCTIMMSNPRQAADPTELIDACILSYEGSLPTGCNLTIEVTNNALDDTPVWEDITAKVAANQVHTFVNDTAASPRGFAFNFRITASRGSVDRAGYFTSVQGAFSTVSSGS